MEKNFDLRFKTPDMVKEAAEKGGKNILIEILMSLGVFIVAQLMSILLMIPVEMVVLFTDEAYMAAAASGDVQAIADATMALVNSNVLVVSQLFITVGPIIVAFLFCKLIQKRKLRTLGFKKSAMVKEYLIGLLVGFVMMLVAVIICLMTGAMELNGISEGFSAATVGMLFIFFLGFMVQGMSEEVLCRGYMLVSTARKKSQIWIAILVRSLLFAALHLANSGISVLAFINLTLFGVFAGVYFVKRGNIWGVAAVHSMWNFAQGNFFGILVSGNRLGSSVFASTADANKTLLNGGDFGLEGGIAVTIVLLVGIVVLGFVKQRDVAEETQVEEAQVEEQPVVSE